MSRYSILPRHMVGIMMLCYTIDWLAGSTFPSEDRLRSKEEDKSTRERASVTTSWVDTLIGD